MARAAARRSPWRRRAIRSWATLMALSADERLHALHELRLRDEADELVHRLPALEEEHGRELHDAELDGRILGLLDVHLDELGFSGELAGDLLHDREEL